jgi:hypothetical protein
MVLVQVAIDGCFVLQGMLLIVEVRLNSHH